MRASKTRLVIGGVLILVLATFASVLTSGGPVVSVAVVGYTTNHWSDDTAAELGSRTYVCAVVAVTNTSKQAFSYLGYGTRLPDLASYTILHQTDFGWKEPDTGFRCGTGLELYPLLPSQGFTFEAVVPTDKACKVAFDYSNGRTPHPAWNKLPYWIARKLPWATPWRTATTEPIDLRTAP